MSVQFVYTKGGSLYALEIDATLQQTHSGSSEVTDHPVEKGANITDHVRVRPVQVRLDVVVSDFPLLRSTPTSGGGTPAVDGKNSSTVALQLYQERTSQPFSVSTTENPFKGRWKKIFEELEFLRTNGILIKILSSSQTYENMVLEDLTMPKSKEWKDAASIQMGLKQIILVETKRVATKKTQVTKTKKKQNKAAQATNTPEAPAQERSLLKAASNASLGG